MKCQVNHQVALLALFLFHIATVIECSLSRVSKVALDKTRELHSPFTVRSVFANFTSLNPLWVQLWRPTVVGALITNHTQFVLYWQQMVAPRYGNGSHEAINIPVPKRVSLTPDMRLGIVNDAFPGPLEEVFRHGNGVVLSIKGRNDTEFPLSTGRSYEFDDLLLPYHIPVFLCNLTGCPDYFRNPPTLSPEVKPIPVTTTQRPRQVEAISAEQKASSFLTEEMIIGLLAWNIILSLLLLFLIIAIIVLCNDIEKLKKNVKRLNYSGSAHSNLAFGIPYTTDMGRHQSYDQVGWQTATGSWRNESVHSDGKSTLVMRDQRRPESSAASHADQTAFDYTIME